MTGTVARIASPAAPPQVLWEDDGRRLARELLPDGTGRIRSVLTLRLTAEQPTSASVEALTHQHELRDVLDGAWAVRPLDLVHEGEKPMLILEDPGGELLEARLGQRLAVDEFLRVAIAMASAVAHLHREGLVHKDLKPAHVLLHPAGGVRLTGMGLASWLPRERMPPAPPKFIAGTLAYMAPEQTGRMNRSMDSRTDLYSLGVTFYRMLTGELPFEATTALEWIHCHVARLPVAPSERVAGIPETLSDIVLKLLAKTAEDRYQTAAGLEHDLRCCLTAWQAHGAIPRLELAANDLPDRLLIPEKLYGRTQEVAVLLDAYGAAAAAGDPRLVLVSGESGLGKSSLVNELHKSMVAQPGLFARGKCDQYRRDAPYATLGQALQSLVQDILGKPEAELERWRSDLRQALGPNGQLMVALIPQLELVIGKQPPVARVPPQDAPARFQLVIQRLLQVFATREHPLVVFLDDLQWADGATLDLLDDVLAAGEVRHLLVVGAYRANEVTPAHPLSQKVASMRASGAVVLDIGLAPLELPDVAELIADALHCSQQRAQSLARLVHEKTRGNPLFAVQFLQALAEEGLLAFQHTHSRWAWSLQRIRARSTTDNVVDLVVAKLGRLAPRSREYLQRFACIGHRASPQMLAVVCEATPEQVHAALWEPVRQGLLLRTDAEYAFQHDRVHEAAYSLIPQGERAALHLRNGRLLAAHPEIAGQGDVIFEIVSQYSRSAHLVVAPEERLRVAQLNLQAVERAKASAAYASAGLYASAGIGMLEAHRWETAHALSFTLELQFAECCHLTGATEQAERSIATLLAHAHDAADRSRVACLQIDMYTTLDRSDLALASGLAFLRATGGDWPEHPSQEQVQREYEHTRAELAARSFDELVALPLMKDSQAAATVDLLGRLTVPVFFTNARLYALLTCRTISLVLRGGNSDAAAAAYVRLGLVAGRLFRDYRAAFDLCDVARRLVDERGLGRLRPVVYFMFGNMVMPWTRHYREGRDLIGAAFREARDTGYLYYATLCANGMAANRFAAGDSLAVIQQEAEERVAFGRSVKFESLTDVLRANLALARMLRGLNPRFGSLDGHDFSEAEVEQRYARKAAMVQFMYWTVKIKACYFAGDLAGARAAESRLEVLFPNNLTTVHPVEYRFFGALVRAASCDGATAADRMLHLAAVQAHQEYLEEWARSCPENFESCAALVRAEIERLSGQPVQAMRLYERAIHRARESGFTHVEALAHQLAAACHAAEGLATSSDMHLVQARKCFLKWGADGKVRQLDAMYPQLSGAHAPAQVATSIGAPLEYLDLGTVVDISRAISGEIVLDKLVATLLRTAIQQAGAQRGVLVVPGRGQPRIEAEAVMDAGAVEVSLRDAAVDDESLPAGIVRYVLRTQESLILEDASAHQAFANDPFVRRHHLRSVFCLPLLTHAKLSAVLYLENNLAPGVFLSGRTEVLRMLASQAAIALENARLYRDVAEREARVRRLVDANIIGTYIWKRDSASDPAAWLPQLVDANDAFLRMVGYHRDDLAQGHLTSAAIATPESAENDARMMEQVRRVGSAPPFEQEYRRKDGSRLPVLMGLAAFDEQATEGLAFVIDLTERKEAEAQAQEKDRRYREVEAALAHASRVATMGQLTASIAHEVSQPIAGMITNAETAMRRLRSEMEGASSALLPIERIVRDGTRARAVIERIRAIVRKAPPRMDSVEINDAAREVIELTSAEARKVQVTVHTSFATGLPPVQGDKVQLQQVILNLAINAIDAMREVPAEQRELWVGTSRSEDGGVSVAVRDSGPGVDPEQLSRLFEAFYTTKTSGLGMGLSICRSIVTAHGGTLEAQPARPRGIVFEFTLPGAPPAAQGAGGTS